MENQPPKIGRTIKSLESLRIQIWVPLPGKEPQAAGVLPEGEGNIEWAVKKAVTDISYSLLADSRNYSSIGLLYTCLFVCAHHFLPLKFILSTSC